MLSTADAQAPLRLDASAAGCPAGPSLAILDDLTGDGVREVLASFGGDPPHASLSGCALVFDGATGAVVRTHLNPEPEQRFGRQAFAVGDLDGDGLADYALTGQQGTRVYAAATGDVLALRQGIGYPAGDPDRDGVADYFVRPESGRVAVQSGRTGEMLFELEPPERPSDFGFSTFYGTPLRLVGDLDGDGAGDLVAANESVGFGDHHGVVELFSGADGTPLYTVFPERLPGGEFACCPVLGPTLDAGDMNGDGVPDLMAGAPLNFDSPGFENTYVMVKSGADGSLLHLIGRNDPERGIGSSVAVVDDLDGDGVRDLVAGTRSHPLVDDEVWVHSGADGRALRTLRLPESQDGMSIAQVRAYRDEEGALWVAVSASYRESADPIRIYLYRDVLGTAAEPRPDEEAPLLDGPFPNPTAGAFRVRVDGPMPEASRLGVYDALGRRVGTVALGARGAGSQVVSYDVSGLAPGLYVVRLEGGGPVRPRTLVVAR